MGLEYYGFFEHQNGYQKWDFMVVCPCASYSHLLKIFQLIFIKLLEESVVEICFNVAIVMIKH
jgi:hypothetical protein